MAVWAGLLATTKAFAVGSPAPTATSMSTTGVPIADPAVQATYERTVSDFLSAHPQPLNPGVHASIADQDAFWIKQAAYWRSMPWEAMAGQWGCKLTGSSVTFNPINAQGVTSAGAGVTASCGSVPKEVASLVGVPETKSEQLANDPALAALAGN